MRTKILDNIQQLITLVFVFLAPIVFLPFFTDPYDFGRQIFILVGVFIVFAFLAIKSFLEKKLSLQKSPYLLSVFLLFLVFVASSAINGPNKMSSLTAIVGPASFLLLLLVLIISANIIKPKFALYALLGSGIVLTLISLILFLGKFTFPLNFPSLNLSIGKAWSPTGSLISQAVILAMLVPIGFALIYEEVQKKNLLLGTLVFLGNTLILAGLGVALYLLTNEAKPILVPQQTAWAIAAESIKNVKFAVFGMGPGQFINAFTSFRPISFNASEFWNLRFGVSSNWYFQLLTEVGLLGLLIYLGLAIKIFKGGWRALRAEKISPFTLAIYISLIIFLLSQLVWPINFSMLIVFFILLGLVEKKEQKIEADFSPLGNLVIIFFAIPLLFFGVLFYFGGKVALANNYFLNSIKAANQNDGIKTYNLQIKAIQTDPSSAAYRMAYAQTNFALANSLATKKDLTDNDKSTISQLIQQSLREAKAAVSLDPGNAVAWENLSSLYSSLINFAQDADTWAVSSYQEAIKVDPLNPRLRIELGGVYYGQKNYNQAANLFLQATNLKPDLANAHYNLANALKELGALVDAKNEYEVAQSLVQIDSNDYQKVTAELEEVKKRIPSPTPTPVAKKPSVPETLSTPQAPAEGINPPLELPNEGPPVTSPPETLSPAPTTPEVSPAP